MESGAPSELCYSARLIEPFLKVLASTVGSDQRLDARLDRLDPDARVPIARAHALLEQALRFTGDPDLGLKAGRSMSTGDCGAVDYAVSSAETVREALENAARYARLVNDVISLPTEKSGSRFLLRLQCEVVLPRAAADFMMAGFFNTHARGWLARLPGLECWFAHVQPAEIAEYRSTFEGAVLRFGMSSYAFAFEEHVLDSPLPSADPKLHAVIRRHAERLLAELPAAHSMTERVRHLMMSELARGRLTAELAARKLRMSRRTLCRKLESEGTTFSELLSDLRRRLALQYVAGRDLGLSEIAFLLGFSEAAAFHRAFKRWTGQTPLEYRRSSRD